MDEKALYKLSYGLYIISSSYQGKDAGCVVNTLHQVTASPVQVSVAVNKNNYTAEIMQKAGRFDAVVLTQDVDMEVIGTFGFYSSKDSDKFAKHAYVRDAHGIPYVKEHTAATLGCRIVQTLDIGSHILFIGEVEEAQVTSDEDVMTYAYYHLVKNGKTPKNASSYQASQETKKVGWRCSICGYVYEGDPLPEDFICPICGAPAAVFEKLD